MSVSGPELHDRKPVELTPTVALTQLIPRGVRERGDQFPTFSNVVEERDNPWIKASVILEPGHLIVSGRPSRGGPAGNADLFLYSSL